MFTNSWIASIPNMPNSPPATVIQPMRWSRSTSSTSDMPSTGKGLNASMQRKPSAFVRFVASSSVSAVPNSPIYPRRRSATRRLLLPLEYFLVLEDRAGRQEVFVEACDEDHVTLEPHADDHRGADQEQQHRIAAHAVEPKPLQRYEVAENRAPIGPGVSAEEAVVNGRKLAQLARIISVENLEDVAIGGHHPHRERDLGKHVEMARGHDVAEL